MKSTKPIKIAENTDPEKLAYGQTVWVQGTIRHSKGNYAHVEIHDGVCGMNACRLTVHHMAIFEPLVVKGDSPKIKKVKCKSGKGRKNGNSLARE